jgi:NAD+ kinase
VHAVGLIINESKPAAIAAGEQVSSYLSSRGIAVEIVLTESAATLSNACELLIVLGGDGTVLAAARLAAPRGVPVLAIHLGHFGFITEASPDALLEAVDAAITGACDTQERMLLHAVLTRSGYPETTLIAMNDIVVASGAVRMVQVHMEVGSDLVATYAADGVIVASPTGSTGYSLSAGGPLVHPSVPAMIVTPIAPHTLSARTLIVPDSEAIRLTIDAETRDAVAVTADGQTNLPLTPGDVVTVTRAPYNAKFLSVGGPNFYQKIRSRWHYAERLSH